MKNKGKTKQTRVKHNNRKISPVQRTVALGLVLMMAMGSLAACTNTGGMTSGVQNKVDSFREDNINIDEFVE